MAYLHDPSGRRSSDAGGTFLKLLQTWALIALGVLLASFSAEGIQFADNQTLLIVVLLLSLFNVLLRPLLILFALPFVILTFGVGILVINALIIYLTATLVDGFHLASFWSALWAALVISFVSFLANILFGPRRMRVVWTGQAPGSRPGPGQPQPRKPKDDDVIDV